MSPTGKSSLSDKETGRLASVVSGLTHRGMSAPTNR